ncbi:MAG: hypothetical protein H0X30_07905 [Anaerolineae bacterium]|nr:hypothetical protein [Anaerolineae bacterium]
MMLRFYLRLALLPLIIFTVMLLVIHAQPYNDHELRAVLLPEGCPAPCFMGIRPGITADEAVKLLEKNKWVEKYEHVVDIIEITWKPGKPDWIANEDDIYGSLLSIPQGIVSDIYIDSNLTLGQFLLSFSDLPIQRFHTYKIGGHSNLQYEAIYEDLGIQILIIKSCSHFHAINVTYQDKVVVVYKSKFRDQEKLTNIYNVPRVDFLGTLCN